MKRILTSAALLAGALLASAQPQQAAPAQGTPANPTTLSIWGVGQSPDDKGFAELIRIFEERNPDIKVRTISMGAGSMNPQKLMTAVVGGVPPDIVRQDRFSISDWAARNAFRPLDDLIERDRGTDPMTPTGDQYYDSVWQEASYKGQVYGIPTGADNRVLYWNREVFRAMAPQLRAAGLDPTRAPRTWSETLAYSKVLTTRDKNGNLTRAGFLPNFGNSWLYMFGFQMNANFMSADGTKCTLNTPEAVKALEFMKAGYEIVGGYSQADRFQSTFRGAENDPFLAGQVAMIINGDWVLGGYYRYKPGLDFDVAPAPVPDDRFNKTGAFADEKDTFITWAGGFAWSIPRGAKHVDAAWRFIKWVTSFEGRMLERTIQNEFEKSRGRRFIPGISAHIETNRESIRLFASGDTAFDRAIRGHVNMMPVAKIRPITFAGQTLWDNHVRAADRAIRGLDTPAKALEDSQAVVQRVLDEFLLEDRYPEINLAIPGYLGLGVALLGILGFVGWIWSKRLKPLELHETKWGYVFIAPWITGFLIFTIGPMVASFFFSFTQYDVLNEARWVGLKNFETLFNQDAELMKRAFFNTFYFAMVGIPLGICTGLAIALLLNMDIKGMKVYRTIYYMPTVVPGVVSIILWLWILNTDPNRGVFNMIWLNTISSWFGSPPPNWMGDAYWTKPALVLMGLWGAGGGMILWLAGLKGIPKTLYEAASIDGATPNQQFWTVTVPMLSPLIFFNIVMGSIGVVQAFDNIYIITRGEGAGPNDSLLMPVYMLFQAGFRDFRMGYASSLAWVIFAVVLLITAVQFLMSKRWVHSEATR